MRDAQNEIVGVLGPGDIVFGTSRKVAQQMSGVSEQFVQKEDKLVNAIEDVKKAIENEGTKTREDSKTTW